MSTGLGRNQLSIIRETANGLSVYAAVPITLDSVVQKNKPTSIQADEVVVEGLVETHGAALDLVCRVLRFAPGARIVTSGRGVSPNWPAGQRPAGPSDAGSSGVDGADGGAGVAGGSVSICADYCTGHVAIEAHGSPGGRAQDGGHAQDGARGANGGKVTVGYGVRTATGADAQPGLPGGRAGLPGITGAGGSGGAIAVRRWRRDATETLQLSATQGSRGSPGDAGRFGVGGEPGTPGSLTERVRICEPNPRWLSVGPTAEVSHVDRMLVTLGNLVDAAQPAAIAALSTGDVADTIEATSSAAFARAAVHHLLPTGCYYETGQTFPGRTALRGDSGDSRSVEVQLRQTQLIGATPQDGAVVEDLCPIDELAIRLSDTGIELQVLAAENAFRSAGLTPDDALRERIDFLLRLLTARTPRSDFTIEMHARVYSMAQKVSIGLDFYGYTLEQAPLLSFDTYKSVIEATVLPSATLIEQSFNAYWDAASAQETKREQLRLAANRGRVAQEDLQNEMQARTVVAERSYRELPILEDRVREAFAILMLREDELQKAINKGNQKDCNVVNVLQCAATIVAGVATGGAGFIAAASAGLKLSEDLEGKGSSLSSLWDQRKVIQGGLEDIGKQAGTVADSITKIDGAFQKLTPVQRALPQFRVERERFDEIAREFADLSQASEYREAGYHYLKCVETRNQAIVDYNAMLVQLIDLQAKGDAAARAVAGFDSAVAASSDPSAPVLVTLMSRLYLDSLDLAAEMVHHERKALAYDLATPLIVRSGATNVAEVAAQHQRTISRDWANAKNRYQARREVGGSSLQFLLRDFSSDKSWELFLRTGGLNFSLRRAHPRYEASLRVISNLRVTSARLTLPGAVLAAGNTQIPWMLVHSGNEQLFPAGKLEYVDGQWVLLDRPAVTFTRHPLKLSGTTPTDGSEPIINPDFSERGLYAGASPFASWLLVLIRDAQLGLDLSALDSTGAMLSFTGYMIE